MDDENIVMASTKETTGSCVAEQAGTSSLATEPDLRFGVIARLYGRAGLERLRQASVAVIGLGGVGSWAVEALARTGVGRLVLVDLDEICVSNVNRQSHALEGTIGRTKVEVLAERVRAINPLCVVDARHAFLTEANAGELLDPGLSGVFDAIDSLKHKQIICDLCVQRRIPVITAGGAAGRVDATQVRIADLGVTHNDPLLARLRKKLRQWHGFTREEGGFFAVAAVYSAEAIRFPHPDGTVCENKPEDANLRLDCASGLGSSTFVTGTFGFAAASWLASRIAQGLTGLPVPVPATRMARARPTRDPFAGSTSSEPSVS